MNLGDVMQAVADRIDTISDLRVYAYPPDTIAPPAAVVTYPGTYTYDATYGRGMDRMELPVIVLVSKPYDRAARALMTKFVDGSGTSSIKTVLESGSYSAFDTVRVARAEFDVIAIGAVEYLAATLNLDIAGQGA